MPALSASDTGTRLGDGVRGGAGGGSFADGREDPTEDLAIARVCLQDRFRWARRARGPGDERGVGLVTGGGDGDGDGTALVPASRRRKPSSSRKAAGEIA